MLRQILILFFLCQSIVFAQEIPTKPEPARYFNDFSGSGLISSEQAALLETKLKNYYDTTSTQVVVVVVKTIQPYEISEYAVKLGRAWGVGQEKKDNGVVVLWATDDRKINISTGYGVEANLTDALSKRIIEQILKPNFKAGTYYEGLDAATSKIFQYLAGQFDADPSTEDASWADIFMILLVIFIIIFVLSKSKGGGGGGYQSTTYTSWGSSSGSWSSSSSDSGSSSSFGGGSFGGGGASGDY